MRSDARARREALIVAARACFARSGYLVPLEDIAERAGVGRGTLYRNFPDRMALVLAIFEKEVERLDARLDRSLPLEQAMGELVIGGASTSALFNRLAADMPMERSNLAAFEALGARFLDILEPFVASAHRDGTLRPDLGAREIMLAVRMIGGLLKPNMTEAEMKAIVGEAIPLLFQGLGPREDSRSA